MRYSAFCRGGALQLGQAREVGGSGPVVLQRVGCPAGQVQGVGEQGVGRKAFQERHGLRPRLAHLGKAVGGPGLVVEGVRVHRGQPRLVQASAVERRQCALGVLVLLAGDFRQAPQVAAQLVGVRVGVLQARELLQAEGLADQRRVLAEGEVQSQQVEACFHVGGEFRRIGGQQRRGLARVALAPLDGHQQAVQVRPHRAGRVFLEQARGQLAGGVQLAQTEAGIRQPVAGFRGVRRLRIGRQMAGEQLGRICKAGLPEAQLPEAEQHAVRARRGKPQVLRQQVGRLLQPAARDPRLRQVQGHAVRQGTPVPRGALPDLHQEILGQLELALPHALDPDLHPQVLQLRRRSGEARFRLLQQTLHLGEVAFRLHGHEQPAIGHGGDLGGRVPQLGVQRYGLGPPAQSPQCFRGVQPVQVAGGCGQRPGGGFIGQRQDLIGPAFLQVRVGQQDHGGRAGAGLRELAAQDLQVLGGRGGVAQRQLGARLLQQGLGRQFRVPRARQELGERPGGALVLLQAQAGLSLPEVHVLEVTGGAVPGLDLADQRQSLLGPIQAQQAHGAVVLGVPGAVGKGEAGYELAVLFQGQQVVAGPVVVFRAREQVLFTDGKSARGYQ